MTAVMSHAHLKSLILAPGAVLDRLHAHATLLAKWNRTHNLTSLAEAQWAETHFLDSWWVVPLAHGGTLVDVGSGGGFPGLIVLAAEPTRRAVFFEKVEKKRAFLRTAIAALGYANASVSATIFPPAEWPGPAVFVSRATWAPADWLAHAAAVARAGDAVITQSAAEPPPAAPSGWARTAFAEHTLPSSGAPRTLARFERI